MNARPPSRLIRFALASPRLSSSLPISSPSCYTYVFVKEECSRECLSPSARINVCPTRPELPPKDHLPKFASQIEEASLVGSHIPHRISLVDERVKSIKDS